MADGALLSFDPAAAPAEHPGGAIHERERAHRALSALRVLALVGAGAAIAQGLTATGWPFATRVRTADDEISRRDMSKKRTRCCAPSI